MPGQRTSFRRDALPSSSDRDKVVPLDRTRLGPDDHSAVRPLVRIHLLGEMRATTYLGDDILPKGRKARAILGCLCLAAGARVPRMRLAAMLWDRVQDDQASRSFRQSLRELRSAASPIVDELLSVTRDTVRLDSDLCWIDALALLAPQPAGIEGMRSDLAALCAGELLEGLDGASVSFDQWLLGERTRFVERLRSLLETELGQIIHSGHDSNKCVSIARRLIAFDPAHEGASRALMRALTNLGERGQALREYERCRNALRRAFDVTPSKETEALYQAIRALTGRGNRSTKDPVEISRPGTGAKSASGVPAYSRLRVGVLPFQALHSSQEENLAFSLSQEIAAALSRFRWFDVIAPACLTRGPSESPVSEDLLKHMKLNYVVDGTLSCNGRHFQISVRLFDITGDVRPVWNDCFKLRVGALHRLNELVTARIVGRIDPVILFIEGQPKRREHYGPTGLLLLAIPLMYSLERGKYEEAGRLINKALTFEPDNAMVLAWAAHWQIYHVGQGWAQDAGRAFAAAQDCALKAIKIDPNNAEALGIYAHVCAFLEKDFDRALYYFDRALRVNPSLAFIWALSALTYCYIGEPEDALRRLAKYRDLTPFDPYPYIYENPYTVAYTMKGDYERAIIVGRRVTKALPDFVNGYKPLLASLGHLGRRDEARHYVEKVLSLEPDFTIERFAQVYPFKKDSDRERYVMGLRLAGVPER
jgi:DNA-binding SARP family transcriptional activator/TolB-like protein/Tfp pilus assembly protein PilF